MLRRFHLLPRHRLSWRAWLVLLLPVMGMLALPAIVPVAEAGTGTPTNGGDCRQDPTYPWMRTVYYANGSPWSPSWQGPWSHGTTVSVVSSGPTGKCVSNGVVWHGTWRQQATTVGRGGPNGNPGYGPERPLAEHTSGSRDIWWSGWPAGTGGLKVAGTWYRSYEPGDGKKEDVFWAADSAVWTEVGSFAVEARCMSATGPLVPVSFSARNGNGSWSASGSGTNWSVSNVPGPSPWTVSASGYGWSGSISLRSGGSHTFVVTGCGTPGGGVSVEAHCNSATGPLVNASAFDGWEEKYWRSGGWYASAGYGATASFTVPTGASTPITVRVWWPDGTQSSATASTGSVVRFVTTNPALCNTPTASMGPTPTPPPPPPCSGGAGPDDGSYMQVSASVPNGMGTVHARGEGTFWDPPAIVPNTVNVSPGQPVQISFVPNAMGAYQPDHEGQATLTIGIRDLNTNQVLLLVEHEDEKELKDSAGVVKVWGRSLRVTKATMNGVTVGGLGDRWAAWQRNWANWGQQSSQPSLNKYLYNVGSGTTTATFTPVNGHSYEAFAMAGRGICYPSPRWSRIRINAREMTATVLEVNLDGTTKGPIANQSFDWFSYTSGGGSWQRNTTTTNAQGRVTFTMPAGRMVGVSPGFEGYASGNTAMRNWVLWRTEHDCTGATRTTLSGTYKGFWDASAPCSVTLFYARVPTISVAARHEDTGAGIPDTQMLLVNAHGNTLRSQDTDGAGATTFTFDEAGTRAQIGAASTRWSIIAASYSSNGMPLFRAVAGTSAQVVTKERINISPVQNSSGNTFFYKPPQRPVTISGSVRTADTAPDPDRPVSSATVTITVRNGSGVLDQRTLTTDGAGNYSYSNTSLPDNQALSVDIVLESWSGSAYRDYVSNQSYPGTVSPGSAGSVARVDTRTLRVTLAQNTGPVSSASNKFDLTTMIPPPQAPALDWKLIVHSRYDGDNVYVSPNDQITWPEGETLDWMPRITQTPALDATIGGETYRYDSKVVAWSFVSSEGSSATSADAMGRSGCRARHKPDWDGGNASMLDGCAYFYDMAYATTTPTAAEMAQQAHAFWGMQTPQDMEPWTYVYQLPRLKRVEVRVQALVKVQTVKLANPATGSPEQPVGNPVFLKVEKPTPFYVNLIAPRSTR